MTRKKSEGKKSADSGGGGSSSSNSKRAAVRSSTDSTYKMHIIKFRLNEKKKVIKRSVNEVLHGKLAGIEKKVEILDKKVKKMKTASKRNLGHNAKHKTKNLMTDVCIVSVNIQSTIGRDSEDIELSRLLRDVIDELMDRFIYRYPLIANVVRIPQFIQNVKSFQVPKYVVCTLLLMGSTVLKNDKFFEAFGEEKRKRTLNYATGHMEKVLVNPDCLGIWTMMILSRYYLTLGILTQYTKYLHLATRLAISMRLHRVDDYYTGSSTNQSESLIVEKELKRRLWWCLYIHSIYVSEAISVQPPIQLKDIFANLPGTDRLWHSDTNLMLPKAKSANKGDVLLSSRGGFKLDTFASYVMLFKIKFEIVTFINRRDIMIAKDTDRDYRCYLKLFIDATEFQKKAVVQFHNELENILAFSIRHPDIVNTMNIGHFVTQYCVLILNTCMTNLHLNCSEIAYYKDATIPFERVKSAKAILIENVIRFLEVLYWLMSNIPTERLDIELILFTSQVFRHLTNLEYIKNLSRYNAIINGKKVISEYFERLKPTFKIAKLYLYLLNNISDVKKSYDNFNVKFKNIPPNFAKTMLSSYDYNPWMVPNGSSYQKRACCHSTLNPKVHDPFLLSRIAAKENLNRDNTFSSTLASEAVDKRMIMTIDLKPTIKESEKLRLSLKSLSISDQSSEKHISHTTNDPTLDDDPKDFYVKVVDFNACPQNITLLNQCKKMLERTFYTILSEDIKEIYKNKTSTPNQHLFSFENKNSSLNLDFTKLLYDPISQGKRYGSNNGYDLSGNNAQAGFNLTVNSMSDS